MNFAVVRETGMISVRKVDMGDMIEAIWLFVGLFLVRQKEKRKRVRW